MQLPSYSSRCSCTGCSLLQVALPQAGFETCVSARQQWLTHTLARPELQLCSRNGHQVATQAPGQGIPARYAIDFWAVYLSSTHAHACHRAGRSHRTRHGGSPKIAQRQLLSRPASSLCVRWDLRGLSVTLALAVGSILERETPTSRRTSSAFSKTSSF